MVYAFDHDAAVRHGIDPASLRGLSALDRVAEILAQGGSLRAVREIGRYADASGANGQLQRIRRQLGWQAQ